MSEFPLFGGKDCSGLIKLELNPASELALFSSFEVEEDTSDCFLLNVSNFSGKLSLHIRRTPPRKRIIPAARVKSSASNFKEENNNSNRLATESSDLKERSGSIESLPPVEESCQSLRSNETAKRTNTSLLKKKNSNASAATKKGIAVGPKVSTPPLSSIGEPITANNLRSKLKEAYRDDEEDATQGQLPMAEKCMAKNVSKLKRKIALGENNNGGGLGARAKGPMTPSMSSAPTKPAGRKESNGSIKNHALKPPQVTNSRRLRALSPLTALSHQQGSVSLHSCPVTTTASDESNTKSEIKKNRPMPAPTLSDSHLHQQRNRPSSSPKQARTKRPLTTSNSIHLLSDTQKQPIQRASSFSSVNDFVRDVGRTPNDRKLVEEMLEASWKEESMAFSVIKPPANNPSTGNDFSSMASSSQHRWSLIKNMNTALKVISNTTTGFLSSKSSQADLLSGNIPNGVARALLRYEAPTRLHELCRQSDVKLRELQEVLECDPSAAAVADSRGQYPLHILGNNDDLITDPIGKNTATVFACMLQ